MLCFVKETVDVRRRLVRRTRDVSRDRTEAAQDSFVVHDSRVVRDIRGGRHDRRQLRDVRGAADLLEHTLGAQRVRQRDRIHRLGMVGELRHRAENLAMRLAVEVFRRQNLERVVNRVVVEQNRAQYGLFCFEILRGTRFRISSDETAT